MVVEPEAVVLAGMLQSIDLSHLCTSDASDNSSSTGPSVDVSERKLTGKVKNIPEKKSKIKRHDSNSALQATSDVDSVAAAVNAVTTTRLLTRLKIVVIDREPLFEVLESLTTQSRILNATVYGMELRRKIEYIQYAYGQLFDVFSRPSSCIGSLHDRKHDIRSPSNSSVQAFKISKTSTSISNMLYFESNNVRIYNFCDAFYSKKQILRLKRRLIGTIGFLPPRHFKTEKLHVSASFESGNYYAEEINVPLLQYFTLNGDNSTIRSVFPEFGLAPYNSTSFKHLYNHWDSLLNTSSECKSSYPPFAKQEEHSSWWIDDTKRDEALIALGDLGGSLSWTGPAS